MTGRIRRLHAEQGQSPWLDNLRRDFLHSGLLQRAIDRGIRGLTSNPTIFQKAIQGSTDYDRQFAELRSAGRSVAECYWEMVVTDIVGALDVFAPLHHESDAGDGYVSVEVDPHLCRDTSGTERAARDLWDRIDRANLMVKIPATVEGLPAIRSMIAEGRNVNVTLIFGLERYAEVIEAYQAGLEDRRSRGLPIDRIASVASFFISRVDSEVDRRLLDVGAPRETLGRTAVVQGRLAYQLFRERFSGPRWEALAAAGARVQRPLWASTSTKNPDYPDTLYVDDLIGPDTVNTLPDATVDAFDDHGTVARTVDADEPADRRFWNELPSLGIDMAEVGRKLEQEGLASFVASFDDLLATLAAKA